MGTLGKHWERRDVKWTREIAEWLAARCPACEHGYASRAEILADLNREFGTGFTERALGTHCYESGIQLGLARSESGVPRGEAHWRHRPVGSIQKKKGYIRIKVAEPNVWMQYQRHVWEAHHPGESAEGMAVIFLDGDNRNFAPENLERVTRAEMGAMAEMGHTREMTRDERVACLLRARIAIAKGNLVGKKEAAKMRAKRGYERRRRDPEAVLKAKERHEKWWREVRADPERYGEILRRNRERRRRKRAENKREEKNG